MEHHGSSEILRPYIYIGMFGYVVKIIVVHMDARDVQLTLQPTYVIQWDERTVWRLYFMEI